MAQTDNQAMSIIDASIVICTYLRTRELFDTLNALCRQSVPRAQFEVVIVDNDPEASAKEACAPFARAFRNLAYVKEESLGVSFARTKGAMQAHGDWVAYLDDDCVPEPTWLEHLLRGTVVSPKPGVVAGTVLPSWSSEPPTWLRPEFHPYLSLCDYAGPASGFWLGFPAQYPLTANSAYPRALLVELGGFSSQLGRKGNDVLLWGEDTELNFRIQKAGYGMWYCPKAVVHHVIPAARMKRSFFRSRYYWDGRTWALLHLRAFGPQKVRKELCRHMTYHLAGLVYYGAVVRRNPFLAECLVRKSFGYIAQAIQILRNGAGQADFTLQGSTV